MSNDYRNQSQYPFGLTGCQFTAIIVGLAIILAIGLVSWGIYRLFIKRTPTPTETTEKRGGPTRKGVPKSAQEAKALYLALGNPSNANENTTNNYLMAKPEYVLSYNCERGIANWVAWQVTASDLGDVQRKDDFRPDGAIPKGCPRITPTDYSRSGYDKGHFCPSADRTADEQTNSATFLMTNMMPQTGDNNRGPWEKMESYTRELVKKGYDVFIIAGAYGEREKLKGKVTVPTNTWKVVVITPQGATSPDDVTKDTHTIAIDIPNTEGIKGDSWRKYRTSIRAIERATGYNLLSNVKQDVQEAIENSTDNQ
jgi:endonuclease G